MSMDSLFRFYDFAVSNMNRYLFAVLPDYFAEYFIYHKKEKQSVSPFYRLYIPPVRIFKVYLVEDGEFTINTEISKLSANELIENRMSITYVKDGQRIYTKKINYVFSEHETRQVQDDFFYFYQKMIYDERQKGRYLFEQIDTTDVENKSIKNTNYKIVNVSRNKLEDAKAKKAIEKYFMFEMDLASYNQFQLEKIRKFLKNMSLNMPIDYSDRDLDRYMVW